MTVIGIRPMIWESRARHSGLGPAGNGPNKCNNFASLERAASPQHSLKLHAIGVSLSVRQRQNESMRSHQLQHLCRETKFQEILQNPPKTGFRSTAHGSIRIQEGQPGSRVSVGRGLSRPGAVMHSAFLHRRAKFRLRAQQAFVSNGGTAFALGRRRGLKKSYSMRTNKRPIAIIRRSMF